MGNWTALTTLDEVRRRAGGRNRYNSLRRDMAAFRRLDVIRLVRRFHGLRRGVQARIARELGISEATVSRDLQALLHRGYVCPTCGSICTRSFRPQPIQTGRRARS